ncbi:hypothetical protein ABPG72_021678 [Tetrahymena utriculariae]
MNNSILQNLNQNNSELIHTDNEYSSSRISFQDQKKIFDFYDIKFVKQGLAGDQDDEIIDNLTVQVNEQINYDKAQNDVIQLQNQLSTTQKESLEQNIQNFKNVYSKPFMNNFPYQNSYDLNTNNTKSLKPQQYKHRNDLTDSQRLIGLNQSRRSDQIIEEESQQKIEISSKLVKKLPAFFPFQFYKLVNDKSSQQVYTKKNKHYLQEKEVKEAIKNVQKVIPVFLPFNNFCLIWDSIFIIASSLFLYIYSILIFFAQQEPLFDEFFRLFQAATILFGLDILVSFNTAYFQKDQIITSQSKIAVKYLKTYLLWDFLSFGILVQKVMIEQQIAFNPNHDVIQYLKNLIVFFKICSLPKKRQNIQNSIIIKSYLKHLLKLFDQILFVVIAAHIVSILWNGLAIIEDRLNFSTTWQQKFQIQGIPWFQIYIFSLYWSVTTMTTSKFMQMKEVNLELQRRVKHYLHFLSQESKDRNKQEEDIILKMLSNKLRDEVLKEINQKVIQQISCLSNSFSQKVIQELIFNIEEILVQPNQIIFKEGEIDEDQCMYFIWSGKVDIFYSDISKQKLNNSKTLTTLEANQIFGEISFFSGFARSASARSVNLATLYKISRAKFLKILSHHLGDFEKFKMIEEQVKSQDNLSAIQLQCYNCKQLGHLSVKCPLINPCFDRQLIILKNNYSIFQQRQKVQQIKDSDLSLDSIESQNDQEGEQINTKQKNLDDLSSDSSQSSNNSRESQSQTSINNVKVSQKKQKQIQKTTFQSVSDKKISIENLNSKSIDHDQNKAATNEQNQKSSINLNEIQLDKQPSNNQNQQIEKNNQRQSQQLSQENKSQDKILSNLINQSSELAINHRQGISDRKISYQASLQQSSVNMNQLCSSLINIVKQQEIQIQTLNQQRESQKQSLNNSKVLDQFSNIDKQDQMEIEKNVLNEFDKAKNFLHFFPHNNLRRVLKQVKILQQKKNHINIKNKIAQQPRRRQNVNLNQSLFDKKTNVVIENHDLIEYFNRSKPTFCSYGFYTKNCALHPLRASQ